MIQIVKSKMNILIYKNDKE